MTTIAMELELMRHGSESVAPATMPVGATFEAGRRATREVRWPTSAVMRRLECGADYGRGWKPARPGAMKAFNAAVLADPTAQGGWLWNDGGRIRLPGGRPWRRTMNLRMAAAAALAWAAMAGAAAGQECEAGAFDCFRLWNGCEPIRSFVALPRSNAAGVQYADVENAVDSRLRAAHIYSPRGGTESLSVFVLFDTARGSAYRDALPPDALTPWRRFSVQLYLQKDDLRDRHGNTGFAYTWSSESSGVTTGGRRKSWRLCAAS